MRVMRPTGSNRATNYSPIRQQVVSNQFDQVQTAIDHHDHDHDDGDDDLILSSSSIELGNNNNTQVKQSYLSSKQGAVIEEVFKKPELLAEEVYVYNCCGLSRELNPTIEFMSTFKCLFFVFNFLVLTFGLANFGMGLWFRIDPKVYEIHKYIETQNFTYAGWIILIAGFLACFISLIGFISTIKQSITLIVIYITILILITIAFIGTLVLLTVYGLGSTLEQFMIKEIYEQMRRRAMNTELDAFVTNDATQFMDFIQVKMRCCGASDFRDYLKLGMTVPTTCYTIDKNYVNAPGCGHSIRQLLDIRAGLAIGFTVGSIVSQLVSIVSSTLILCSIYHWRANSRKQVVVKQTPISRATTPVRQQQASRTFSSTRSSPVNYNLQKPRSRTPIVI